MRLSSVALHLIALAVGSLPLRLRAQATILVDPADPVYRDLSRLANAGMADRLIVGQKPYSRREILRIIDSAATKLGRRQHDLSAEEGRGNANAEEEQLRFLASLIAQVRERFDGDSTSPRREGTRTLVQPLRSTSLDLTRTTAPTRRVPENNGLGAIDADLNTMLANRRGRPLVEGSNAIAATEHLFESANIALFIRPELHFYQRDGGRLATAGRIHELQLRMLFKNVALDIGRENLLWSQGEDVGLLLSNNSPGLDLIRLSNERLITPPWVFRRLGSTKLSVFYADLGASQSFPHAYLVAYKISIAPSTRFELGGSVSIKSGGRGSPPASFTNRILDLFPFLDAGNYGNVIGVRGKFESSDKYAGFDGRLRWAKARGTELFWEVLLNDFDVRRLGSVFWEDAGHVVGLSVGRLDQAGRLAGSIEYHHTGIRYYLHEQFLSGQTLRRTLIGDPLGPDAQGAYATVDWYQSARNRVSVQAAVEHRSNDQYEYLPVPLPDFGFRRTEIRPKEVRARAMVTWQHLPPRGGIGILTQFGYERGNNFDFTSQRRESGLLVRLGVEYRVQ